jgi:hypothetical protein
MTEAQDPYTEAPNSTVDDWLGQSVERDEQLADRLVAEEGGDLGAAQRRFEAEATGAEEQHRRLHPEDADEGRSVPSEDTDPASPGATLLDDDLAQAEPNEPA